MHSTSDCISDVSEKGNNVHQNQDSPTAVGGGRVVRWCWVNFQCQGVLLIWIIVGQGPTALAVGVGGGCLDIFLSPIISLFLSPSLWETAQYRLKYCLKGPLSSKQPTNQPSDSCKTSCSFYGKKNPATGCRALYHKKYGM